MLQFNQALKAFETGMRFELIGATLTLTQLKELCYCTEKKRKPVVSLNPGYSIHLENILVVSDACLKEDDEVMSGAVTSREHMICLPSEKYADACIVHFYRNCQMTKLSSDEYRPILTKNLKRNEYRWESTSELEYYLMDLFAECHFWKSVTLKNVQLLADGVRQYPSLRFYYRLMVALKHQVETLKSLALSMVATPLDSYKTKINLTGDEGKARYVLNSKSLLDVSKFKIEFRLFLIEAVKLESLNIVSGEPVSSFLQELKGTLIKHPNLKSLGFGNLLLNKGDYSTLNDLLDENYYIFALEIPEPIDDELKDAHGCLMDKLQLPGDIRFRQQQLTQSKLVHIAVEAIENDTINQLAFVVGPEIKRKEIVTNKEMFENLFETLPSVYRRYRSYTQTYVDHFKLPLWESFKDNPSETVGCYLLKRAIEKENGPMIINLIEAGANLFEYYKVCENGKAIISLLNEAVGLESLNITAGEPVSSFLQELKGTLITHPNLKSLGFGNLLLNKGDYSILNDLLDENYSIFALEISEPIDEGLKDAHNCLMDKLQLPGDIRFRQQQLTQSKLVHIAIEAIENDTINQLAFVVGPEIKRKEILTNEEMFKNLFETLPSVYRRYRSYTQTYVDHFKLPLWENFKDNSSQTVGCYLLKRAIEKENGPMIINLIEAGANLYEYYKVYESGKSLLSLLNDSNVALSSVWKKNLAEKLKQQDLSLFFPAMQRLSSREIRTGFYNLKAHLDDYLCKWLSRSQWPEFVKIITGVYFCFQERQKDWETAAGKLANALEVGTRNGMSDSALVELENAVEDLIGKTGSAKCGFLGRSELNDGLQLCGKQLKEEIERYRRNLNQRHDSEIDLNSQLARSSLENKLQEKEQELKRKDQEIQQLRNLVRNLSCKSPSASSDEDIF